MRTEGGRIAVVKRARAYDPSSAAEPCDQRMIHHPVTAFASATTANADAAKLCGCNRLMIRHDRSRST